MYSQKISAWEKNHDIVITQFSSLVEQQETL